MMIDDVLEELERAKQLHPKWPLDPLHAAAIIGEEYGEMIQAILQLTYEYPKADLEDVRREAVQTAAMALRFLENFDHYYYNESDQYDPLA